MSPSSPPVAADPLGSPPRVLVPLLVCLLAAEVLVGIYGVTLALWLVDGVGAALVTLPLALATCAATALLVATCVAVLRSRPRWPGRERSTRILLLMTAVLQLPGATLVLSGRWTVVDVAAAATTTTVICCCLRLAFPPPPAQVAASAPVPSSTRITDPSTSR